jgi:hypothetical protein
MLPSLHYLLQDIRSSQQETRDKSDRSRILVLQVFEIAHNIFWPETALTIVLSVASETQI